jgi:ribosomal protein L28
MARRCAICGKKSMVSVIRKKLRGNYNPTGKRVKHPNLQWVYLESGKRVMACTKCIKAMSKTR